MAGKKSLKRRHFGLSRIIPWFFGVTIFFLLFSIFIIKDLPSPANLAMPTQSTKIYDRRGQLLYSIYVDENRTYVPLPQISDYLKKATLAVEDKDFYKHGAINIVGGIIRAVRDMTLYHRLQGGSTITQQLAKSALLSPERTLPRKIKELILAVWIEKLYSKDKILEMYLNQVPYGGTSYGVEEAAQNYFATRSADLTLAQSSLLAGLPQAPTYYSPFGTDPSRAKIRQKEVLLRLLGDKIITSPQFDQALKEELKFAPAKKPQLATHFVLYIKEQLVKKYGDELVEKGGLKVTTTLDLNLQKFSETMVLTGVEEQKNLKVSNGAALVTNPATGEILAMVGSANYFATPSGNVNVVFAPRSPGSVLKPINYALGFLKGNSNPATPWIDAPFCFPPASGRDKTYCPQNYDGQFHGVVQTRFALGNSFNIPAVKQLALNTVEEFIAAASAMGLATLTDKNRYGYSLTLGGGEVTMFDLATAFSVFANAGCRQNLISLLKVEDNTGKILEKHSPQPFNLRARILSPEVTYLISHILLDDSSRSLTFGAGSILNIPGKVVSVKTGTTEDKRDNWTIGYTPSLLTAVWVGNNDNSPMSPYLESGNTGAAAIWHKIMREALKDKPAEWPVKPDGIEFLEVCSLSGLLPDHNCPTRGEYFIKGQAPTERDNVWDQKKDGHILLSDPLQQNFCVDCPL